MLVIILGCNQNALDGKLYKIKMSMISEKGEIAACFQGYKLNSILMTRCLGLIITSRDLVTRAFHLAANLKFPV